MMPATIDIPASERSNVHIALTGSTKLLANDILFVLAKDKPSLELRKHC